jgi:hypothetical protein
MTATCASRRSPVAGTYGPLRAAVAFCVAAGIVSGCAVQVDDSGLLSTEGYTGWHQIETRGDLPAHKDTIRVIFVNGEARRGFHEARYRDGSVLVKEIYHRRGDERGPLSYVAFMRKVGTGSFDAPVEGGWLFTMADTPDGDERYLKTCWRSCHFQAPYDGAWLDYTK